MQNIPQTETKDGDERVPVSIRLPKSIDRAVEIAAAHKDCSKQRLIEDALRAYLATDAADAA